VAANTVVLLTGYHLEFLPNQRMRPPNRHADTR
jgi:hypothetical protein